MNHLKFNAIVDEVLTSIFEVLQQKSVEYSSEGDRLHNFKAAGLLDEVSPEKSLLGMMAKQEVSVRDIVKGIDKGKKFTKAQLDEKLGDWINYLILLKGLLIERLQDEA